MRNFWSILILLFTTLSLFGQRNDVPVGESSVDISYGPSTLFLGDIGNPFQEDFFVTRNRFNNPMVANSTIAVGFHQYLSERSAYKVSIHSGIYDRKDANYAFRASVFQLTGRYEFQFFTSYYPLIKSLYAFGGLGFLYSNYYTDRITTPHSSVVNSAIAPVVPVGIGFKHEIFDRFSIGAEFDVHYSFTDMIEGKKGGLPHDALSTLSLILSYQISDGNGRLRGCNCRW